MATSHDQVEGLLAQGLGRGSWRTIRSYVYAWLRLESWYEVSGVHPDNWDEASRTWEELESGQREDSIFPLSSVTFTRYTRHLIAVQECGPTVPDAARSAFVWIGKRVGFEVVVDSPLAQAMIDEVWLEKGKPRREAPPIPLEVVKLLERTVDSPDVSVPLRLLPWRILVLTFGTLRSNDGLHTCPDLLELHKSFMGGESWRSKVERKGRGTKWTVCRGSLPGVDWVSVGHELLIADATVRRDYLLNAPSADFKEFVADRPLEYDYALIVFRLTLIKLGVDPALVRTLSLHSPRGTVPTLAAHSGQGESAIQWQGNWSSAEMPGKYVRHAGTIPLKMIEELTAKPRDGWTPSYEKERKTSVVVAVEPDPSKPANFAGLATADGSLIDGEFYEEVPVKSFFRSKMSATRVVHFASKLGGGRTACLRFESAHLGCAGPEIPDKFSVCSCCVLKEPSTVPDEDPDSTLTHQEFLLSKIPSAPDPELTFLRRAAADLIDHTKEQRRVRRRTKGPSATSVVSPT